MNPLGDIGLVAARLQLDNRRQELFAVEQHRGARIFENELKFVRHEAPVQRNHDTTDLGDCKERREELVRVHHQQRHSVALVHRRRDRVSHLVRARIQLLIRKPSTSSHVVERFEIRVDVRALGKKLTDVDLHGRHFGIAR